MLKVLQSLFENETIPAEIKNNIALIWTYELKSKIPDLTEEFIKGLQKKNSGPDNLVVYLMCAHISIFCVGTFNFSF